MSQMNVAQANALFMDSALERNYVMQSYTITGLSQLIDIELDAVPGWAHSIDLSVYLNVNIASSSLPSLSPFAPWNIFHDVNISLGGGPFQRVSPFFHYLRETTSAYGWAPGTSAVSQPYATSSVYNVPSIANGDQYWKFNIRIPLQVQPGTTAGLIPLGSSSTKMKIRLTTATALYGTDQYYCPLYGGSGVTATIGTAQQSYVRPTINYYTTPATKADVPNPRVGMVLNVQEKATSFVGAGTLTPIKFPDPFRYLRLWHIVIDGTGAPNTTGVNGFELDLTPGYPQYNYSDAGALHSYFYRVRRQYGTDLPVGVFVFDLFAGSEPANPNGTQTIDGTLWQTLQTQLSVTSGTNVASPAKIVTFAEALSPVAF